MIQSKISYAYLFSIFSTVHGNNMKSLKAEYISKVIRDAQLTKTPEVRYLEEVDVDLSGYEIKFERCQFVKAYNDEMAQDEDLDTVLGVQKFIIFRLCPSGTCKSCVSNYGEYIVSMETYLEAALDYVKEWQQNMCDQCDEVCAAVDDMNDGGRRLDIAVDCNTCVGDCQKINAMEDNGFLEASDYIECQEIYNGDDGAQFYAAGVCSADGSKIKIGVFSDEYCSNLENNMNVLDFLGGMQLSHAILKQIYNDTTCISCTEQNWDIPDDDVGQNGDDEEKEVIEMCENLYQEAAKCESIHGIDNYWKDNADFINQYKNEDNVCEFISSLNGNNYDQGGEIIVDGAMTITKDSSTTVGQAFALVFYGVGIICFSIYAAKLYKQVKEAKEKAGLLLQGTGNLT